MTASWITRFFGGSKHGRRHRQSIDTTSPFVPATLPPRRDGKKSDPVQIYSDFRLRALSLSRAHLEIPEPPADAPAWGLLVEMASAKGILALLALADGTTKICFSTDGHIADGEDHEAFRNVARIFVRLAGRSLPLMAGTEKFPAPTNGQTFFYVFTDYGVFAAGAMEADLIGGKSALSPLFYAGHVVLRQLGSGPTPS